MFSTPLLEDAVEGRLHFLSREAMLEEELNHELHHRLVSPVGEVKSACEDLGRAGAEEPDDELRGLFELLLQLFLLQAELVVSLAASAGPLPAVLVLSHSFLHYTILSAPCQAPTKLDLDYLCARISRDPATE